MGEMKVVSYNFNEESGILTVVFSVYEDGEEITRKLPFNFWDIQYYLPYVMSIDDLSDITEDMIIELISLYLDENET